MVVDNIELHMNKSKHVLIHSIGILKPQTNVRLTYYHCNGNHLNVRPTKIFGRTDAPITLPSLCDTQSVHFFKTIIYDCIELYFFLYTK